MVNPLLQKYEELHNPKQPEPPEPPKSTYNHLRPEEHRLVYYLEKMIQDIKDGKVFYDSCEEEKENYAMKMHLDFTAPSYIHPNWIKRGKMINIRVFRTYD